MRSAVGRALRFSARHPEDWFVWTLRAGLALSAFVAFFTPPYLRATSPGPLAGTVVAGVATGLFISALATRRPRTMRFVELAILSLAAVHVAGHLLGLYDAITYYDTIVHAFGGFAAGLAAWGLSIATRWFWDYDGETPFRAAYLVLSFVALAALVIEGFEFGSDVVLGTLEQTDPVQDPLTDTMVDLLVGLAAGVAAAAIVGVLTWWGRRAGFYTIVETPVPPGEDGSPRHG